MACCPLPRQPAPIPSPAHSRSGLSDAQQQAQRQEAGSVAHSRKAHGNHCPRKHRGGQKAARRQRDAGCLGGHLGQVPDKEQACRVGAGRATKGRMLSDVFMAISYRRTVAACPTRPIAGRPTVQCRDTLLLTAAQAVHGAREPQLFVHLQRRKRQITAVQLAAQADQEERRQQVPARGRGGMRSPQDERRSADGSGGGRCTLLGNI